MKELICITCPKGCHLKVDEENGYAVTGNSCPRGRSLWQGGAVPPHPGGDLHRKLHRRSTPPLPGQDPIPPCPRTPCLMWPPPWMQWN